MAGDRSPLLHDPTAGIECHRPDDRFIPLRAGDLVAALAGDAGRLVDPQERLEANGRQGRRPLQDGTAQDEAARDRAAQDESARDRVGPGVGQIGARGGDADGVEVSAEAVLGIGQAVEEVIDQELAAFERRVAECYTAFNPDCDTHPQKDVTCARTPEGYRELNARLEYLLVKANFTRLTDAQIRSAVRTANSFGLRVRLRPERLAQLGVWVRGQGHTRRVTRTWRHPWRGQARELPVYRRLALVTRLQGEPYVNLKLFKEIPIADVEALLPHADVQMTWFDQIKLVGSGAGLVGSTALKVAKLLGTIIYWSRLLWVVLFGAGLLAWRTFSGYRYACTLRDSMRTKHLYYQNLDNNAGVIHSLVSMIAQEEVKEAILAYWFCRAGALATADGLRGRIEAYLAKRFGIAVSFDVEDAIRTLERLGLWEDREGLRVVEPGEAQRRLREHWRVGKTIGYHGERAGAAGKNKDS